MFSEVAPPTVRFDDDVVGLHVHDVGSGEDVSQNVEPGAAGLLNTDPEKRSTDKCKTYQSKTFLFKGLYTLFSS